MGHLGFIRCQLTLGDLQVSISVYWAWVWFLWVQVQCRKTWPSVYPWQTSDPFSKSYKLTYTCPKLNTYQAIFSTCQLIISSFTTITSTNSLTSFQWLILKFFSSMFIVSPMSPWHKHGCTSCTYILVSHLCHATSIGPLNFGKW